MHDWEKAPTHCFLKGERSVSRGGNGELLLWLITRRGPGRAQCHFHCQAHYTTEDPPHPHPHHQSPMSSILSCNVKEAFHGAFRRRQPETCRMHIFTLNTSEELSREQKWNHIYFSEGEADFTCSISNSNSRLSAATMWRSAKSIRTEQNWSVVAKGRAARRLEGYSAPD